MRDGLLFARQIRQTKYISLISYGRKQLARLIGIEKTYADERKEIFRLLYE